MGADLLILHTDAQDADDLKLGAAHEAGHAVLALSFEWTVQPMMLVPSTIFLSPPDAPEHTDPIGSIAFLAGGHCAETLASGNRIGFARAVLDRRRQG